jgi:hypothetical protein
VEGNKIIGSRAVTAIGTISLIHHIAIQIIIPNSLKPLSVISSGGFKNKVERKRIGPRIL